MAKGNSNRQKFLPGIELKYLSRLDHFARYGKQRLIEAKGNIPDLAGKNRKDTGNFDTHQSPRKQGQQGGKGKGDIA